MIQTIRALFTQGMIKPLEKIDLAEGDLISVTISEPTGQVRNSREAARFKFDWAGGLKGCFGELSSVDLQHKSMEWR